SAGDVNAKRAFISTHLMPLLTRGDQRDQAHRELQAAKNDADLEKLANQVRDIAKRATEPEPKPDENSGRRDIRRRAIADFLYNYDAGPEWRARVATIVGLDQYVLAADRQYTN